MDKYEKSYCKKCIMKNGDPGVVIKVVYGILMIREEIKNTKIISQKS